MLILRRGLVPVCLTLGALMSAMPLRADTPAAPVIQASSPQIIVLQNVVPSDIVKLMHWDLPSRLPAGVTQIVSVPLQNALLVTATPAGLAQVRQSVKSADVEPRQVQIKVVCANLSEADLKASGLELDLAPLPAPDLKQGFIRSTAGPLAARFLQTLTSKKAVTIEPIITSSNNVGASLRLSATDLPSVSQQISVTPRINSDNSIILALSAAFSEGATKQAVSTLRTLKSGETLILPPASAGEKNLLLFVTSTLK